MSVVYLWLDVETTGLHVETSQILEVAWILTKPDLTPLHTTEVSNCVIDHGEMTMSPFVAQMHAHSGLLDALNVGPRVDVETAEATILDDLPRDVDIQLAGSGVHFDKAMIAHHMPLLHGRLHYRIMDVSVIRRFVSDVCGVALERAEVVHRAADDVRQALAEAHELRELIIP